MFRDRRLDCGRPMPPVGSLGRKPEVCGPPPFFRFCGDYLRSEEKRDGRLACDRAGILDGGLPPFGSPHPNPSPWPSLSEILKAMERGDFGRLCLPRCSSFRCSEQVQHLENSLSF